jgi:hypothetical protein
MKNREFSEEEAFRKFGSHLKRKPFQLVQKAQRLSSTIENCTAKCEKNYRGGIVAQVRQLSYQLIHQIRAANENKLGTQARLDIQDAAGETIEQIYDLMPVLRTCRCITPTQEGLIEEDLCYLKGSYLSWIKSDRKRLFTGIYSITEEILENTRAASLRYDNLEMGRQLSLLERVMKEEETDGDVLRFAGVLQKIREEHFRVTDYFLWGISEDGRFIFANKGWTRFFAIQVMTDYKMQIQYRDERGFFYETDTIQHAVERFHAKKK